MARPAASSFAELTRKPEDRRCSDVAREAWELETLRCAFSDSRLVLMTEAMICFLLLDIPASRRTKDPSARVRHPCFSAPARLGKRAFAAAPDASQPLKLCHFPEGALSQHFGLLAGPRY